MKSRRHGATRHVQPEADWRWGGEAATHWRHVKTFERPGRQGVGFCETALAGQPSSCKRRAPAGRRITRSSAGAGGSPAGGHRRELRAHSESRRRPLVTCHWQSRVAPHNTAHPHCPFKASPCLGCPCSFSIRLPSPASGSSRLGIDCVRVQPRLRLRRPRPPSESPPRPSPPARPCPSARAPVSDVRAAAAKHACQWHFKLPVTTSRRGGADLSGRRAELGDWGPDSGGANLARNRWQ